MAVRNFFVKTETDGNVTTKGTGPRSKDGGFYTRIYIRDQGQIRLAFTIAGYVDSDNPKDIKLQVTSTNHLTDSISLVETTR